MRIYEEAIRLLDEIVEIDDFLAKSNSKRKILTQGDFTFAGTR
jgi:hypothetical protein